MIDLMEEVAQADEVELDKLLHAVLHRYAILVPDWEVSIICLKKAPTKTSNLTELSQCWKG